VLGQRRINDGGQLLLAKRMREIDELLVHRDSYLTLSHTTILPKRRSQNTARTSPGYTATADPAAHSRHAGYLVDTKAPEGPYFEVAIIHHTDCGSALLADDELRHGFAQRIGTDERTLADTTVLDPARTVQTDVNRVLWAEEIPQNVRVSGHVYDVGTGLVTTVIDAKSRK
jgi:hypothetical protein